ncbi:hypothetical protein ACKGJO_06570 [Gracilimonas sp. Q87]|uniref:hypothetical protein n=1 Tax=Gracilimonas sp. Q87 TaxID=3384766 RepID=UPI003983FB22
MSNIYEAVRQQIKTKLPKERVVDDQVVETNRDEILNSVPFHVKRTIAKLQERSILPPKMIAKKAEEVKKTFVNNNGENVFDYIKMPEDFSELQNVRIEDSSAEYTYWENEFNIDRMAQLRNEPLYKDTRIEIEGDFQDIVALSPFPKAGETMYIEYVFYPDEEYIDNLPEKYWNSVISSVEMRLGIGSPRQAEEDANEASSKWRQTHKRNPNLRVRSSTRNLGRRRRRRTI